MKRVHLACSLLLAWLFLPGAPAQTGEPPAPVKQLAGALAQLARIFEAPTNAAPQTFTTTLRILKAEGLPKDLVGREIGLALEAPDRLRISAPWEGREFILGRDRQELWIAVPAKRFGVRGRPDVPLFASAPDRLDTQPLGPVRLPIPAGELALLPLLMRTKALPAQTVGNTLCDVLEATALPQAVESLKLPSGTLRLWVRQDDLMPLRVGYREGGTELQVELRQPQFTAAWPAAEWQCPAAEGDTVDTVARAHLTRFLKVAMGMLGEKIPTLGPASGERRVVAREGRGRLELIDGTRVLLLRGTPEEMGRQHGTLMRREIRSLVDHMVYGVGVASSFEKGRWFFAEIESAQRRLTPFTAARSLREMDAMADAAGLPREEVRLANFFPELFHCSGFAVFGSATAGGRLYHGRVLDYLRGLGLEQNAVVIVLQPDEGNAWANVSYAGFVGSVTAMNEKHVAIGEMGGRGEGHWDGKPMAQLVREVMEKANTIEEAVDIMRQGPRTCEYYYVISDAKSQRAVGIAATPDSFETIWPGQSHPRLPHAIPDAVLLSAGDRYEELARRVRARHGKLDAQGARDLMKRPVCMNSNIHSVLFEPETLDFWVANADSENPAAHTRYTRYNLAQLLEPEETE